MKKKLIIIMTISLSIIIIGITIFIIAKNNIIANKESELQQKQDIIDSINTENENIDNELNDIDLQLKELEENYDLENEDSEEIKSKVNELKNKKEELNIKKDENNNKKQEIEKQINEQQNDSEQQNNKQDNNNNQQNNNEQKNSNQQTSEPQYEINVSTTNFTVEEGMEGTFEVYFTNPKADFLSFNIKEQNSNGVISMYYEVLDNGKKVKPIIKGLKVGTTQLKITEDNTPNVTKLVNVTVTPKINVSGIEIKKSYVEIMWGQKEVVTVSAKVLPIGARNRNIIWKSSNENVAKPYPYIAKDDIACTIQPVGAGTCTFTATSEDGEYSATCQVVVKGISVTGVRTDSSVKTYGYMGESIQLKWYVDPYNATNRKVNWTSDNTSVAIVNSEGLVTLKGIGITNIRGITDDGGYELLYVVQCL